MAGERRRGAERRRHPKLPFEPDKLNNLHGGGAGAAAAAGEAAASSSKPKPGVRGSLKK